MAKKLFIVESPGKIKTIQKALGPEFTVEASVGHCYQIDPTNTAIDIKNNYEPTYVPIPKKKDVIAKLKKLSKSADEVYICTDADREGSAIGMHLVKFAIDKKCKIWRVKFQEITKTAILAALKHPGTMEDDIHLYNSQQARSVVDRLVGFGVSPVLWKAVASGTSAGRVQSIGLMFISERQKEIDAFKPEEYWSINGEFNVKDKKIACEYKPKEKLTNETQTKDIVTAIKDVKTWTVTDVKKQRKSKSPDALFITSSLQQFASNQFGWDGKRTMSIAQSLYEGHSIKGNDPTGLITYHRTDSTNISTEAATAVRDLIKQAYGKKYLPESVIVYKTKDSSAQEAHEGIRPAHLEYSLKDVEDSIPEDQFKLYEAIYKKFVSCQMADALFDVTKIVIESKDQKHQFNANGQTQMFDGYLKVWTYATSKELILPDIDVDDDAKLTDVKPLQHFTKPPATYNTASLIDILKKKGIGRPSTYATIIDTLIRREYIIKEGKSFLPTELGKKVSDFLQKNFPELMNDNYTARIETELDEIAEANKVWYKVVDGFYKELKKRLDATGGMKREKEMTQHKCTVCDKNYLVKRFGKYGSFYGCDGYSKKGDDHCDAIFKIAADGTPIAKEKKVTEYADGVKCDKCGSKMAIRTSSRTGKQFLGCSSFPKCKRMMNMEGEPMEFNKFKKYKGKGKGKKKKDTEESDD